MSTTPASQLLLRRDFAAFFTTQLLGAFNDNLFKNALVIWISSTQASAFGLTPAMMITLCTGVFILPFFLFSATAGQLSDRYEKTPILRVVKGAEILIMGVAAVAFLQGNLTVLLGTLFCMGAQSAFVGPVKYSILPQLLGADELVAGNALVETGTFLAILLGTIAGGVLILMDNGPALVAVGVCATALLGFAGSYLVPRLAPGSSAVQVSKNPITPTLEILRITARQRPVFLSVLGISWFWLFGAVLLSLFPVYARETLRASDHVVTLFLAFFCVGIALGSMLTEKISGANLELGLVPFGSIGMTLFTLDLFLVGAPGSAPAELYSVSQFLALPHTPRVLVDLFGISVFGGFFTVPLYTLLQQRSADDERSRVIAGNNILNAVFMVAGAGMLAGLFAAGMAIHQVFLVLAVLSAGVAVYLYSFMPEFLLRFYAFLLSRVMYRLTVTGHHHIPETGPVVLVANHVAFNDWLIVGGSVRRPARFVMDHRISQTPVVSRLFRSAKVIPIAPAHENEEVMEQAFAKIREELQNGEVVCIFPEGKLTSTGEMNPFKAGIERIIAETPVPVVPMALGGLWGSMFSRKDGPALSKPPSRFRAKITLDIGAPIPPEQVSAQLLEDTVRGMLRS
ncbi:MAG: MFS transporter [Polyangiales bacterium]|nr:MFS transporter [Myxococcales bacterium]MCB9657526.1 MFS transporter [Sandaracinaceae bacterium]